MTQMLFALFLAFFGLNAQAGGGSQQQTLEADRLASFTAPAVFATGQVIEGCVDLVEQCLFPLKLAQLPLPLFFGAADIGRVAAGFVLAQEF